LTKIFINFLFLLSDGLKRCHDEVNKEVKWMYKEGPVIYVEEIPCHLPRENENNHKICVLAWIRTEHFLNTSQKHSFYLERLKTMKICVFGLDSNQEFPKYKSEAFLLPRETENNNEICVMAWIRTKNFLNTSQKHYCLGHLIS
jgi:hypothetical protein